VHRLEEWCPTSPKAIYLVPAEVADRNGETKTVKQPFVDPKLCTGCGACEYACPIKGSPAIYVTSAGETRSRANQFLLKETSPGRVNHEETPALPAHADVERRHPP